MKKTIIKWLLFWIFMWLWLFSTIIWYWVWTNLSNQNDWDIITKDIWNNLIDKVNQNWNTINTYFSSWWIFLTSWENKILLDYETLKNIKIQTSPKKYWYRFWTHNTTDNTHFWYWVGSNFRNCEDIQYFEIGETYQNTIVNTILADNLWVDRKLRSSSPKHAMYLRDFSLNPSYSDTNHIYYWSWATFKYWPSSLQKCEVD